MIYFQKEANLKNQRLETNWVGTFSMQNLGQVWMQINTQVKNLENNPGVSVLVTNQVGEPEGWVSFDGEVKVSDFETSEWIALIERVAPRYWDLSDSGYAAEIDGWKQAPQAFVSLKMKPETIRSGA